MPAFRSPPRIGPEGGAPRRRRQAPDVRARIRATALAALLESEGYVAHAGTAEDGRPILMRDFAPLGLSMEEMERAGRLRVACRYPEATSHEDLLIDLRVGLDELRPSLIVLDSIRSIEHSTSKSGFRQLMAGASQLRGHRRSALLIQPVGSNEQEERDAPVLSTVPDAICLLDYDRSGRDLERTSRSSRWAARHRSPRSAGCTSSGEGCASNVCAGRDVHPAPFRPPGPGAYPPLGGPWPYYLCPPAGCVSRRC